MNNQVNTYSEGKFEEAVHLRELSICQGIKIWGTDHEILEEQALHELQKFSEEHSQNDNLENGKVKEKSKENNTNSGTSILNIQNYINKQAELKKRHDFNKSLGVGSCSKELANKVSNKNCNHTKKKWDTSKNQSVQVANTGNTIIRQPHFYKQNYTQVILASDDTNREDQRDIYENDHFHNENTSESPSGSEYFPSEDEIDSDYEQGYENSEDNTQSNTRIKKPTKRKKKSSILDEQVGEKVGVKDDGLLEYYKSRLSLYYKNLEKEHCLKQLDEDKEIETDHLLKGGLKVPLTLWNKLYSYQQDGVEWLWEIHKKSTGGLLGDEMGLGKTVQIIVFLHALEYSRIISCHGRFDGLGPSIIVCPATVLHQWVNHFHEWAPEFRVAVLHQSGSYQGKKTQLIKEIHKSKGIIITTYQGILKFKGNLLEHIWHYMILDEGHKVRTPTAKVTIAVKEFRTPHRVMLTGTPMQNNLTELWSLFDFTNPGMLGSLMMFQEHFATPILHGGFANSTPMQEATALSVATALKNIITHYMLRRSKNEVKHHIFLPNKSEQVLFCSLTHEQKDLYKEYLMSEHVNMILGRGTKHWFSNNHMRANVLVAITTLRKICNHPDIYLCASDDNKLKYDDNDIPIESRFGYYKKSGKMIVVSALLKIWKKQGHRVLLFTQGRSMIAIFQDFLEQQNYKYLKMDGSTSVSSRQIIINQFNKDNSYDVFLLTTRVGGLGVNLTGADRVIIFDPDWNPATDTQARERAWRIGQDKNVTIYRLLSAGTIEEKMYQRQVWKQLLSNKVLLDPRTNRFFKGSDLHDLFSLQESTDSNPETANIFHDSRVRIQENIKRKREETHKDSHKEKPKSKKSKMESSPKEDGTMFQFTEDKIKAMKNLAQQLAKSLTQSKEQKPMAKTTDQLELEEERRKKLKEKEQLKKLTPQELLHYNKEKASRKEDDTTNKIDNCETDVSFSKALQYSETTAKLHHVLNSGKLNNPDVIKQKAVEIHTAIVKVNNSNLHLNTKKGEGQLSCTETETDYKKEKHKKKKMDRNKQVIDNSGVIGGEKIEGLVKSEWTKRKRETQKEKEEKESQDDFVLGKLFAKKGVSGALKHDSIINSGYKVTSLKVHTEAKMRTEKSLEALKKSRLDNWRW